MSSATPRVVLLTSSKRRHRYVARRLADEVELAGVVSEEKVTLQNAGAATERDDEGVVAEHFARREAAERRHLGEQVDFPGVPRIERPYGCVNDDDVVHWVHERAPEVVVLYGTGIVRPPLLDDFAGRMVNLHLGLSPYYRGSGTNFWPLVEGKPECVGATLHQAVAEVDAGAVLKQVRPPARRTDRAHDLGTKTIIAAVQALPAVVRRCAAGNAGGVAQDLSRGAVYRRSDFDAEAVRCLWRNFECGMMDEYVAHREERCRRYPLVE